MAEEQREIVLAFLSALPFDTFEETETGLNAYLPASQISDFSEEALSDLQERFGIQWDKSLIKSQNWNAVWESNFQPIIVGNFCGIRADFHPPLTHVEHEILLNPRMAFGTGHHATTYMVIEQMSGINFQNEKVLDYGCGTGILAILAARLGAQPIDAVDIEAAAWENTLENCRINGVPEVTVFHGTLDAIEDFGYGIILANINRNVILDSLSTLYEKLEKNGKLIVSGILIQDQKLVEQTALQAGFKANISVERDKWICQIFTK